MLLNWISSKDITETLFRSQHSKPVEVGLIEGRVPAGYHRLHVLLPQPHRLLVGERVERRLAVVTSHPAVTNTTKMNIRGAALHQSVVRKNTSAWCLTTKFLDRLVIIRKDIYSQWFFSTIIYHIHRMVVVVSSNNR